MCKVRLPESLICSLCLVSGSFAPSVPWCGSLPCIIAFWLLFQLYQNIDRCARVNKKNLPGRQVNMHHFDLAVLLILGQGKLFSFVPADQIFDMGK